MRDFSLNVYQKLLDALQEASYAFQTFSDYLQRPEARSVMLRHDVDDRKLHSLAFAKIQHAHGIRGTYYFRMVPQSFDEGVIREIYDMGHEVGYHYEDMDFANGDPAAAIQFFEKHLEKLRAVAPVTSICMHGSPRSQYDNKDVWKHYDYRQYGIIGEPYFDLDFEEVFYLTDTGMRWDGHRFSVRDKVKTNFDFTFRTTDQIIASLQRRELPPKIMLNFHPQRWTDDQLLWWREKKSQQLKNMVKYWLIKLRKAS